MPIVVGTWQIPPDSLSLSTHQVDLWRFRLNLPESRIDKLKTLLSADEIARAERLLVAQKMRQFVVARARLRQILALYLDRDPGSLVFDYAKQGKPALCGAESCHFNLAHSGNIGLLAVSAAELGVDTELIDPELDYQLLAKRFFSDEEKALLTSSPRWRLHRTFYRLWTAKESWLKLQGSGFSAADQMSSERGSRLYFHLSRGYVASLSFSDPVSIINKYDLG